MDFGSLVQGPGERHMLYGGTRTGKSSLEDWSVRYIQATRPTAMILIADTKPRFRAEREVFGVNGKFRRKAEKKYRHWAAGPVLPNSVAVDMESDHPFRGLWNSERYPGEAAIMQARTGDMEDRKTMLELMKHFVEKPIGNRERLVVIDEGLDFYSRNSFSVNFGADIPMLIAQAGGERNVGLMFCAHRPRGIPPLLNMHSSRVTLFHLRYAADMNHLYDMGIPPEEGSPDGDYIFRQYVVKPGGTISEPVTARLSLPESYLKQLAAT